MKSNRNQTQGAAVHVKSVSSLALLRPKKQQDDRLLKRLSRVDRKQQEQLRQLILSDPLFSTM